MEGSGAPRTIVLLHGFAGTRRAWDGVVAAMACGGVAPLALDLPGHGAAAGAPRPISFETCLADVLARAPERFELCGYSLGGRVALHVALAAPARVSRVVLVSTSAGIEGAGARAARRRADRALADALEREPFEKFIEHWRSQPLFAGEPAAASERARADHRRNRPESLAAALRGLGAGEMRPLWRRLGELSMPVELVVGARDPKYAEIARRMQASIASARLTVLPGGHGLVQECPAELGELLTRAAADERRPRGQAAP